MTSSESKPAVNASFFHTKFTEESARHACNHIEEILVNENEDIKKLHEAYQLASRLYMSTDKNLAADLQWKIHCFSGIAQYKIGYLTNQPKTCKLDEKINVARKVGFGISDWRRCEHIIETM